MKTESQRVGHYELQQRLGQDNAGETWRAYDNNTQRIVLLKLYRTDALDGADALTTYLDNIEKVAALHHPNIARIYDIQLLPPNQVSKTSSLVCLAIEYVEGETLADYIKDTAQVGKLPPSADIVQIFSALALALDNAHQRGIIHGNLKPANILLAQSATGQKRPGAPMITDFGQTRFLARKHSNEIPFYLAPEQVRGAAANERSDIYTLGVLLYELYTGSPPFRGNRPIAVMMQHINAQPTAPDLMNPGVSPALAQVILRCLAKDPLDRFPNATSLAVTLANALHVPISENLRHAALLLSQDTETDHSRAGSRSARKVPPVGQSVPSSAVPAPGSVGMVKDADLSMPPGLNRPDPLLVPRRKSQAPSLIIISMILLVLLLSVSIGAMAFMRGHGSSTTAGALSVVGHASFLNSGQLNESTTQGINDELQIDIANLPAPASGKNYYAWLLGDSSQSEAVPLMLGRLTPDQGNVHFLYRGDSQHTNLLTFASRFLINEDDAHNPSSNPLLDQSTWRYYAAIPQTPDPADKLHFSMLDHLRHLLVESPELAIRGLHGGLAFWFARDASAVSASADGLARDWQNKDTNTLHAQVVRILDYLDGSSYITPDVPAGTPFLADAQTAQVALLGPAPHEAYAPGFVFQNEPPPGYVYLVQTHLNGALLAPQATSTQHQLAIQINAGIDGARRALAQVYQDAKELVGMTAAQLLQASALTLLDDMATQAQYASTGRPDPATGTSQGGALWIYNNLQRLATFEVAPYIAKKA